MEVIVRKWGNSLGVILPKEMVEGQRIKEKDKIHISIVKPLDLKPMYAERKNKNVRSRIQKPCTFRLGDVNI